MKNSKKTADAIHILAFLEINKKLSQITSETIAEDLNVNASYIRQLLSKLRKGKIITETENNKSHILTKKPIEITLFDVYNAVETKKQMFMINKNINFNSQNAIKTQQSISEYYNILQKSVEKNMKTITLAHILEKIKK